VELYHYFSIHIHGVHRDLISLTLEHMSFPSVLSLAVGAKMQKTEVCMGYIAIGGEIHRTVQNWEYRISW
jgi:hypothetical protein